MGREKNPGTRPISGGEGAGGDMMLPPANIPTLAQLGITKQESSRWQRIAKIPEDKFEGYVARAQHLRQSDFIHAQARFKVQNRVAPKLPDGTFNVILADPRVGIIGAGITFLLSIGLARTVYLDGFPRKKAGVVRGTYQRIDAKGQDSKPSH